MRKRAITIDAENEEEYINKLDSIHRKRSRLSLKNFDIDSDDEEDGLRPKKINKIINEEEEEFDYSNLGYQIGNYDEENSFDDQLFDDSINNNEDQISSCENGLDLLCLYLKNSISSKNNLISEKDNSIFYRNKNALHTLSGNAIYDLNIRELVDNIMDDKDNNNNENDNNSLREFITKNIEADFKIKIMAISNSTSFKGTLLNQFFGIVENKDLNNKNNSQLFQIRKKVIRMFNKNINIEFFDTSDSFLNDSTSFIYYKLSSAFFFFIEATSHNIIQFLDNTFSKIEKYIENKTLVLIGLNMLFKEDCSIDGENLREYANDKGMIFISMKINNFDMKNSLVQNLFSLILIKGIDLRKNYTSNRKSSHDNGIKGYKTNLTKKINNSSNKKYKYDITKMNIPNSLGYKKQYRIKHINAFDILDDNDKTKYKRKLSIDL